ncbi:unnamed protein product, partial [Amoebophrya sp. A120]
MKQWRAILAEGGEPFGLGAAGCTSNTVAGHSHIDETGQEHVFGVKDTFSNLVLQPTESTLTMLQSSAEPGGVLSALTVEEVAAGLQQEWHKAENLAGRRHMEVMKITNENEEDLTRRESRESTGLMDWIQLPSPAGMFDCLGFGAKTPSQNSDEKAARRSDEFGPVSQQVYDELRRAIDLGFLHCVAAALLTFPGLVQPFLTPEELREVSSWRGEAAGRDDQFGGAGVGMSKGRESKDKHPHNHKHRRGRRDENYRHHEVDDDYEMKNYKRSRKHS